MPCFVYQEVILLESFQFESKMPSFPANFMKKTDDRSFRDSLWILEQVMRLKEKGDLSKELQLWAVANPNIESSIRHLESKVERISLNVICLRTFQIERGVNTIITQPPLNDRSFVNWWNQVRRKDLFKKARFLIGMPMVSSMDNFQFWHRLCDIPFTHFHSSFNGSAFWQEWNQKFFEKVNFLLQTMEEKDIFSLSIWKALVDFISCRPQNTVEDSQSIC